MADGGGWDDMKPDGAGVCERGGGYGEGVGVCESGGGYPEGAPD